jgi:hypothetical protein
LESPLLLPVPSLLRSGSEPTSTIPKRSSPCSVSVPEEQHKNNAELMEEEGLTANAGATTNYIIRVTCLVKAYHI